MSTKERPESRARWLLHYLMLGVGATVAAVGAALLIDVVFDPGWSWSGIAIVLLAVATALLIVAATTAGSGLPYAANYDRFDALLAILPPFVTAVVLLVTVGF